MMGKHTSVSKRVVMTQRVCTWLSLISLWSALLGCNLLAGSDKSETPSEQAPNTADSGEKPSASQKTKGESAQTSEKGELKPQENIKGTVPTGAVAQVNGALISQASFDQLFEERARVYRLQKRPIPPRLVKTYKTSALQKLIDQTLLQQYFDENQLKLTDDERAAAYQSYKSRFRGEKSYQRFLERSDKSEDSVKEQVYFDALVDKALLKTEKLLKFASFTLLKY